MTLKNFDEKIGSNIKNNWMASPERIELQDKYFNLYRHFILVNEQMFKNFQNYFKITSTNNEIFHVHKKGEGDFIIMNNYQFYDSQNKVNYQNSILIGIINKEKNEFEIQHLFDYKDRNQLQNELNILIKNKLQNYINNRTSISQYNNKDIFSPLFRNNQIIGNYYRHGKNNIYINYINYTDLLSNNQLYTVACLCRNEISIKEKLLSMNYDEEEFYLIKNEVLADIKKENNYSQLKNYFEDKIKDTPPELKEIYNIIKSLPQNSLNNLINNLKLTYIPKALPSFYEIDITPVTNPINPREEYMILKDFKLIDKKLANIIIKDKYPYHILKCSFVGNSMIVFHYSNNILNNNNYILVVTKIDDNNNFINEYLLIYKQQNYIQSHFYQIKYNLLNFLQSLNFVNNIAPIVMNVYHEIGNVIKLSGRSGQLASIRLYFESMDQRLQCSVVCKETDIFNTVVNKVFRMEPRFKENFNYFLCNGNRINDYKSIKDNNIKDGDHILLNCFEE